MEGRLALAQKQKQRQGEEPPVSEGFRSSGQFERVPAALCFLFLNPEDLCALPVSTPFYLAAEKEIVLLESTTPACNVLSHILYLTFSLSFLVITAWGTSVVHSVSWFL